MATSSNKRGGATQASPATNRRGANGRNRPGPGKDLLPELLEKLDIIRDCSAALLTMEQTAAKLGIARATWYRYQAKSKRIRDAVLEGKRIALGDVENAVFKSALGFHAEDEEVIIDSDGKKRFKRVKKYYPPDKSHQQFLLKKLNPDVYGDKEKESRFDSQGIQKDAEITPNAPDELVVTVVYGKD